MLPNTGAPPDMDRETRFFSRQVILADSAVPAEIVVRGNRILAVEPRSTATDSAEDWGDDLLMPGLIDIHTDNLEKHYQPRPGATWDAIGAVIAHDGQCAAAGITTVFDSLSMHGERNGLNRGEAFAVMADAITRAGEDGLLRLDHKLHVRCEVTNDAMQERLGPQQENSRLGMLSMMDHRPGQRQMANRRNASAEAPARVYDEALCARNRQAVAELARGRDIALAAHDDATEAHVAEARGHGATIAEFPVTLDAARAARAAGMSIAMGGPNLVRGGSHSGNLSAREAARHDLLDILASDYIPLSLLRGAFLLAEEPFGWSLPRALATVTNAPARATGLADRGRLSEGLRADIIRVAWQPGQWPRLRGTYCAGERVG
ncbi:MAG: alpha-D-ribose 1-methylphosphonate 5-triphosphate diphosphatase [Sphingomonadaceae bacterium]